MSPARKHEFSMTPSEVLRYFLVLLRKFLRGFHLDREKSKAADWAMFGVTALGLIAAVASAIFLYMQLRDAQDNFKVDERAWIQLEPIKPPSISVDKDTGVASVTYELSLKNIGKTVARHARFHVAFVPASGLIGESDIVSRQEALANEDYPVAESGGAPHKQFQSKPNRWLETVIGPGATTPLPFRVSTDNRTTSTQLLLGHIDYTDEFDVPHWSRFCYILPQNFSGNLLMCAYGNQVDGHLEVIP